MNKSSLLNCQSLRSSSGVFLLSRTTRKLLRLLVSGPALPQPSVLAFDTPHQSPSGCAHTRALPQIHRPNPCSLHPNNNNHNHDLKPETEKLPVMADRYIPEHRRTQFKAKNTFKPEELRRRREEQQVEIRKAKREENLAKRRGFLTGDSRPGAALGAAPDSDDDQPPTESQVCIWFFFSTGAKRGGGRWSSCCDVMPD